MAESISLIIITYNRPDDLLDLLQSLAKQSDISPLREVLILNNASTVSYQHAEQYINEHPELKVNYILSQENLGVSRGRNKLMSMAQAELILVLDDDIVFHTDNSLPVIATVFTKEFFIKANTGIITFRVIYYDTKEQQQTALPHKQFEEYRHKPVFLTSYFTGCSHVIRKELLTQTGLYPTDFFYGMEEYDLSYRVINAGYSLGYDAAVTFEHKESPTGRQLNYQKLASQWVNKSKVARRYLPFIYYLTTMTGWSFEYIKKAKGHWGTFFSSWLKAIKAGFTEKRNPVSKKGLEYLKEVHARLWY
ncbi:glycosyltransferase [Terrimonas sp. NA20]|uniref:Glycosyltransferase n=1 Tax=Terrimonas ginsenosidimutans TaxID=2908004 RepID=A0ABS9KSU3_9BACT|nr:glycosyltransferase [Terrimonas ginsenosidimutans]MCG2615394.1 glycosyltransferase [Terrimonas ginsenosidimutans]